MNPGRMRCSILGSRVDINAKITPNSVIAVMMQIILDITCNKVEVLTGSTELVNVYKA